MMKFVLFFAFSGIVLVHAENCQYNGVTYEPGDSFPADDLCNTCFCSDNGEVGCTFKVCGCEYNGKFYNNGETFEADDGCNTCFCDDGRVACTLMMCPEQCYYKGVYYEVGESFMDKCNNCECLGNLQVKCTRKKCNENEV